MFLHLTREHNFFSKYHSFDRAHSRDCSTLLVVYDSLLVQKLSFRIICWLCFFSSTAYVSPRPRFTPTFPRKNPPHKITKDDGNWRKTQLVLCLIDFPLLTARPPAQAVRDLQLAGLGAPGGSAWALPFRLLAPELPARSHQQYSQELPRPPTERPRLRKVLPRNVPLLTHWESFSRNKVSTNQFELHLYFYSVLRLIVAYPSVVFTNANVVELITHTKYNIYLHPTR